MILGRACGLGVAIIAAVLAVSPNDTILSLISFAWAAASGGLFDLYELLPGFVFALLTAVVVSRATYRRNEESEEEFTSAAAMATARGT